MGQQSVLDRLADNGIVAVLRSESASQAVEMAQAIVKGGITSVELTFSTPNVIEAIERLRVYYQAQPEVVIGVGSVLDAISARLAILAGAAFIVSPAFDAETAMLCNLYQVPYFPGGVTVTEIITAMKYGVKLIKLFPGSLVGPAYIRAVKAPLPQVNIMPTGGVNLDNMSDWFRAGAMAVGVGGQLSKMGEGGLVALTEKAKAYRKKYEEIRSEMNG